MVANIALLALTALHTSKVLAGYTLQDTYDSTNWASKFDFFTDADPTNGYVDYVAQSEASSSGLFNTQNNAVYMGVDHSNVASGRGRKSVRITSKAVYNHGLIVLDLNHMPSSTCGLWPAFWTVGPSWPNNGEIDIIEGVNTQNYNAMTLHTSSGCSISSPRPGGSGSSAASLGAMTGKLSTPNCDVNAPGQSQNAGCGVTTAQTDTYGSGLNAVNGGVYATEWTSDVIRVWFFPAGQAPDMSSPDPTTWGTPLAAFSDSGCDIDSYFKNHQIVFDTTFCGAWAGSVWSTDSTCAAKAATCQDYVQNNPSAFSDAYWSVNSLKVFQNNGAQSVSSAAPVASSSKASAAPSIPVTSSQAPIPITSASVSIPVSKPSSSAPNFVSQASNGNPFVSTVSSKTVATQASSGQIQESYTGRPTESFTYSHDGTSEYGRPTASAGGFYGASSYAAVPSVPISSSSEVSVPTPTLTSASPAATTSQGPQYIQEGSDGHVFVSMVNTASVIAKVAAPSSATTASLSTSSFPAITSTVTAVVSPIASSTAKPTTTSASSHNGGGWADWQGRDNDKRSAPPARRAQQTPEVVVPQNESINVDSEEHENIKAAMHKHFLMHKRRHAQW